MQGNAEFCSPKIDLNYVLLEPMPLTESPLICENFSTYPSQGARVPVLGTQLSKHLFYQDIVKD